MKSLSKFYISVVSIFLTATSFASSSSSTLTNEQLKAQLRKVSTQTIQLQKEINELRTELHHRQSHPSETKTHKNSKTLSHAHVNNNEHLSANEHSVVTQHEKPATAHRIKELKKQDKAYLDLNHHYWTIFRHPVTVTTSPFMGVRSAFGASDLLDQQSTMNEDLILLRQRSILSQELAKEGFDLSRPIIEISGGTAGVMLYSSGTGDYAGSSSSVNLSTAELDFNAVASRWANAFLSLDYDDSPAETGSRAPNSRIYLRRGFLTIGNLNYSDFYFTIGQFYMPFGRYSSALVTAPLTLSMGRILDRGAILGFTSHGFYAQLYGFEGSQTSVKGTFFKQGGFNLGVKRPIRIGNFDIGAGIVSNIADSEGMQNNRTGPSTLFLFHGFGEPPSKSGGPNNLNNLRHRVPAVDVHAEFSLGRFALKGEYITVTRSFDPMDLTFNLQGAFPQALHTELDYNFHVRAHPVTLGVAYGETWQAFALNLPKRSIWALLQTSIWKDTIESIEYRHDINYKAGTVASGGTIPGAGAFLPLIPQFPNSPSSGGSRNIVTMQIGVYF